MQLRCLPAKEVKRRKTMDGISRKIYLELEEPTEEDFRSSQMRILDGLKEKNISARLSLPVMQKLYPLAEEAGWRVTVSLAWDGEGWLAVDLEKGDTTRIHLGLAADLGSTTVVMRLVDCDRGECLCETSRYNRQIAFGTDILTRIFYCKDDEEKRREVQKATVDTLLDCMEELEESSGTRRQDWISMIVSGNTTMIHFLLGMDAFCVFYTPYAVRADRPGFLRAGELGLPLKGCLFCTPARSNYLGGDIISGLAAVKLHEKEEISLFFDIGTNGELVIGNRDFLLCGAGAAGPALEGGVVKTGMRAARGAVDQVRLRDGQFQVHVMGEGKAEGICGSGIIDLLAELFLEGWVDIRGKLVPGKSSLIRQAEGDWAVEYAPGLLFYQKDMDEFIKTKAAAHTMVEIMLRESGISMDEIHRFYVAGAFGKHVSKESAIAIGMYPDMDRDRIVNAGNASLQGAQELLLDRELTGRLGEILDKMVYIQFGAVDDFLHMMVAAQALPHTDFHRFPTVMEELKRRSGTEL
ncbi:MAG: ASKHA domain-containing protein [Eubacteriales bacterium]|nr:ASKHA domain-containing protein [Eubacteriales bacterium]